jgi:dTDP-4-amino-4,6-dideoxygalactose transaminase
MPVPLLDLKAQYAGIKDEIRQAIDRVLERGQFILGEEVRQFETEFADFCEAKYCVGAASGTAALQLALQACGVRAGDLVITGAFTFTGTAEPIVALGAKPVFIDVDPTTFTLDLDQLESAVKQWRRQGPSKGVGEVKAVIPVHLYGHPADMEPIHAIAQRYDLKVIEDCAQAHGARYRGRRVGLLGDIGCFSFFPAKNLGACGDAGAVVTNDEKIAEQVRMLSNHGRLEKYEHIAPGYTFRLDTLQAAILRVKLSHLEAWTQARREAARRYDELLQGVGLQLPAEKPWARHVYHLYVVRHAQRDHLQAHLKSAGIGTGLHYPLPLHLQPAYRSLGYRQGDFVESERAAASCLSLPMYPELTAEAQQEVAYAIASWKPPA